jgi:hypothetical protein
VLHHELEDLIWQGDEIRHHIIWQGDEIRHHVAVVVVLSMAVAQCLSAMRDRVFWHDGGILLGCPTVRAALPLIPV